MKIATTDKPRLVLYGIGQYGQHIARFAAQKGWPIVAAYNRAGDKVGQDLGRVAGLDRDLGVIIQDCDTARYDGLAADVGIVTQTNLLKLNALAHQRLLGAGLNVMCHGSESYYPHGNDAEAAEQLDALAKARGVSFCGGGIWDMSRISSGLLVAGPCTEIRSLFHSSITDANHQVVSWQQAQQVGCGFSVAQFDQLGLRNSPIARSYKTIPEQVLSALGYTVSESSARCEPVTYDEPVYSAIKGGVLEAGLCAGTCIIIDVATREGVNAHAEIDLRLFRPGEVEHMFWEVDGVPRSRVRVERDDSAHATASNLFNRIRDVIAAPPGVVLVSQLGRMQHTALG